jgi:beta-lactam-binding protein with PASTA domain/glucose/arabinose dehydrogenase
MNFLLAKNTENLFSRTQEIFKQPRNCGAWLYLILCLVTLLVPNLELQGAALPAGFSETDVPGPTGGGWNEAVGMTFDATGRTYVWEKAGRVWIKEYGSNTWSTLIDISEEVGDWGDYGLLGFALDPDFQANGNIYLMYEVDRHYLLNFGTPNYSSLSNSYNAATIGRITRYTARASDGFRTVDLISRRILLGENKGNGPPFLHDSHGVGSLVFGTDGTLLASVGDGASYTSDDVGSAPETYYAQALSDGIIKPKENVGAYRSQLVDSLSGKILRIDPATGDGIPSNPFYDAANPRAARSRVWALGVRNSYRMTLRPNTGSHFAADANPGILYIGEVGYNTWEELNVCAGPGKNFGWPVFEGIEVQSGYYNKSPQNQDAPNPQYPSAGCSQYFLFRDLVKQNSSAAANQPPFANPCNAGQRIPSSVPQFLQTTPAADWEHYTVLSRTWIYNASGVATPINIGATGAPVSGPQFGGNCSIGGVWYTGADFPAQYKNMYFHADYGEGWIKYWNFDANDKPLSVANFATAGGPIVCLASHPIDGGLYYITATTTIRKITYSSNGNVPPKAVAGANITYGPGPLSVQFTGNNSSDPEGQPLTYRWNFGDGTAASTAANPSHTFNAAAGVPTAYQVTLTVTDNVGQTSTATIIVSLNNTPPAVAITSPVDRSLYPMSSLSTYTLSANVSDNESADPLLKYEWKVFLHHNNHEHAEPIDTNHLTTAVITPIGCDGNIYYYRIELTVTDPAGLASTREVKIFPDCGVVDTAPTISQIADQNTFRGVPVGPLSFTVGDGQVAAGNLQFRALSSNPTLVPTNNIVFGGADSNKTVTVTPVPGIEGASTITIVVNDGPNDVTSSFVLTVAGAPPAPPSLVAAYGFNEGSGSSVADISGNGNSGTINAATWTNAGKFGSALVFNGSSSWVTINASQSLALKNGMTVEAWVYPTTLSGWRTIALQERPGGLAYSLYAYDNAPRPAGYINVGGSDISASGTAQPPLNAWTHLAMTYDGAALKMYVNGTLVKSTSVSGNIVSSTSPLRIGGNSLWGEYFSGRIDEVRIYNRALSVGEIQTDMTTAVDLIAVPNVVGQTQSAASGAITAAHLIVGTVTLASSASVPAGSVISQNPVAGSQVSSGSTVNLTVSSGPPPVVVPSVVGLTQVGATNALASSGLLVGATSFVTSSTVAAGNVISQSPVPGTQVAPASAVNLVISTGPPAPVTVPDVVGQTRQTATNTIIASGLVVGPITNAFSSTISIGLIISENPAAGTSVPTGSTVYLIVSSGPPPVTVPNLVGQTQGDALTTITNVGLLIGTTSMVSSTTVAQGLVISQLPTAGTQVANGSAVNLVISAGPPPPVTVPDVVGQTRQVATNNLINAGLVAGTISTASSTTVPAGAVISENPAAGSQVPGGSAVDLTISSGPPMVATPNVVGQTQPTAGNTITNAGLIVGTHSDGASSTIPVGSVMIQSPTAGVQVILGSAVNLTICTGAPPVLIAVDKLVFSDGNSTRTTAAFSTSGADRILVVFASSDGPTSGGQQVTITGAGLTWQLAKRSNVQAGSSEIWWAAAPSVLNNVTVKATQKSTGYHQSLTVVAFSGAKGVGASNVGSASTGAPSVTVTTTAAGSLVYGVGNDWDSATGRGLPTGQALAHQWVDTGVGDTFWVQATSSPVVTPSAVQIRDTSPTTDRWNLAGVEILGK